MSQASAEFIPTRIAILYRFQPSAAKRTTLPVTGCARRRRRRGTKSSRRRSSKRIATPSAPQVSAWIASDNVQVVLITGGTGFTDGDQAPEALLPLFDREVEGFGEVFRMLSLFEEIGTSTLQSRAVATSPTAR